MSTTSSNIVLLRIISNTCGIFDFAVEKDGTVGDTRVLLEAQILGEGDSSRIKMTFRGQVLEKDDALWSSLNPQPNESMYAVVVAARSVMPTGVPPGASLSSSGSSGEQARLMEPMVDAMVSNPGFLDMMIGMSPELKTMIEKHPEMKRHLQDPDMLKQIMRSQYDPMARRDMDRSLNSQMAQLNNIPGGMAMLEGMLGNMLREDQYGPKTQADKQMATEANSRPQEGASANTREAPNPWARQPANQPPFATSGAFNPNAGMRPSFGFPPMMPPFNFFSPPSIPPVPAAASSPAPLLPAALAQPPAVDYSAQISILRDMGFDDDDLLKRALTASGGDVDAAVAFIDREQNP